MREASDVDLRGIAAGAGIIAAGIAFSLAFSALFFEHQDAIARPAIPAPELLTDPLRERDAYFKEKNALLHSSGPGRMPIEEAMRRLAR